MKNQFLSVFALFLLLTCVAFAQEPTSLEKHKNDSIAAANSSKGVVEEGKKKAFRGQLLLVAALLA